MYAYMMYLPDTEPMALRTVNSNKQCINLNSNDFREWYCAANKPFNLLRLRSAQVLRDNLFRCHARVSVGGVVFVSSGINRIYQQSINQIKCKQYEKTQTQYCR